MNAVIKYFFKLMLMFLPVYATAQEQSASNITFLNPILR